MAIVPTRYFAVASTTIPAVLACLSQVALSEAAARTWT
jgi:hypothetical protein